MEINYRDDPHVAGMYDVIDAATGEKIDFPFVEASDSPGLIRYYKSERSSTGTLIFQRGPDGGMPPLIEDLRPIRIVPNDRNPLGDEIRQKQAMVEWMRDPKNRSRIDLDQDAYESESRVEAAELDALFWQAAYLRMKKRYYARLTEGLAGLIWEEKL